MMISGEEEDKAVKGVRFLSRVVKKGLTEQVTLEPTPGGGGGGKHLDIGWKDLAGRGNSKCKAEVRQYGWCLLGSELPSVRWGLGVGRRPTSNAL